MPTHSNLVISYVEICKTFKLGPNPIKTFLGIIDSNQLVRFTLENISAKHGPLY